MKPMLAHKYANYISEVKFPHFVQPKLNGVRMLYHDGQSQSRDGHWWDEAMLVEIKEELVGLSDDFILDGELYRHGWSLQKINSAISVNRNAPNKDTSQVEYHVFDCVLKSNPTLPFKTRWEKLIEELSNFYIEGLVRVVPTLLVQDISEAENQYAYFKRQQYEGLMYRDPHSSYGFASQCKNKENRWKCLLKRKDWMDDEAPVVSVNEGEGKYSGMCGSLTLRLESGLTFEVGSGLSDMQRVDFMSNPPVGKLCRYKYEMLSDNGTPLKPIFEAIFD